MLLICISLWLIEKLLRPFDNLCIYYVNCLLKVIAHSLIVCVAHSSDIKTCLYILRTLLLPDFIIQCLFLYASLISIKLACHN
jgi:hypothetical protein